jgi:cytochrome b
MNKHKILVWDMPTRVFHWLLAFSFAGAFLTADSERLRNVHVGLGYTMLGLLAFRLLWGIGGTRYARFSSFAFGPRRVGSYIKSVLTFSPQHFVGHNPAGSWAIYAMLGLGLLTGVTGYAAYNEIGGEWLGDVHESAANVFLAIVIVHVAGVIVGSLIHRENLVRSMWNGYKLGPPDAGIRYRHRAVAVALVLAIGASWIAGPDPLSALSGSQLMTSADHRVQDDERH